MTNRKQAKVLLERLNERGIPNETILEWIINNYLEGSQAIEALQLFEMEWFDDVFDNPSTWPYEEEEE